MDISTQIHQFTTNDWIVLFGPPGSGKGTVAKMLQEEKKFVHVCSGDLLRHEMWQQTNIGTRYKKEIAEGQFVPTEVINKLVQQKLDAYQNSTIILDGYPRTENQLSWLQTYATQRKITLSYLHLKLNLNECKKRMQGRLTCKKCDAVYSATIRPPKMPNQCDHCEGEVIQRESDKETNIDTRLQTYDDTYSQLLLLIKENNRFFSLDASFSIEEIYQSILGK